VNRSSTIHAALGLAALAALAGCPGASEEQAPYVPPPQTVIGQAAFDVVPPASACTAKSLSQPWGPVASDGSVLVVADTASFRLLAFAPIPGTVSGPAASWAIGEPDLLTCDDPRSPFLFPQAPSFAGNKLLVTDTAWGQVLIFDPVQSGSGVVAPSVLLGAAGCVQSGLSTPESAVVVGTKLLVADSSYARVLVWDPVPAVSTGAAGATDPTIALGQADLVSCTPNRDGASRGAGSLFNPSGIWSDGTRLVVADTGNHRVLVWNTFPAADGAAADAVLGQASFTTATAAAGAGGLNGPTSVTSDGTHLFVADSGNHRVLVYPSIPAAGTLGMSATAVIGQPDLDSHSPNAGGGTTPGARTLYNPTGVALVGGALFVTDSGNSRVLGYRPAVP